MIHLRSLTNRIFLSSTLLASVAIGFAMYFVGTRLRQEAEAELQRDLSEAVSLVEQQRDFLLESYARTARLIADLPKLKAAVETGDPPTIAPIARDYQEQAGSDLFRVTDRTGQVLADLGDAGSGVLELVSVPISIGLDRPELLGTLTLGYRLDDRRAALFKTLSGADIAFAVGGDVRASTLPSRAGPLLASLSTGPGAPRVVIDGTEYAALVQPLREAPAVKSAAPSPPVAIVLRSRTDRMRTLSAIETALGLAALVTFLVAAVVSYGVARTVTRPLARITDHMRQVAATGDLTRKLELGPSGGWQDEDARVLATTFNALTESVARFQREAAQRERLSSLGRMSTVIAHEVRNPLMIIKGALRQLRQKGATADDIRDATADIDGEIERLNRVVNDVLDFARPMRFDRTSTDINALCRAVVSAVTAADPEPAVAGTFDPALRPLQTDSEHLRTALVNLVTNARQAVLARNGHRPAMSAAPVALVTKQLADGRVAVVVEDQGGGIAAKDLPHIFDPYFTTRRAGTGLGLPIAKNIIDGLGGTMSVVSTPGAGTSIRIELSDAPMMTE